MSSSKAYAVDRSYLALRRFGSVLVAAARLVPTRLHDRGFWTTQGLVAGVTLAHYLVEFSAWFGDDRGFHVVPVTAYIIPVIYASLRFGFEGGTLTSIMAFILSIPNMFLWHSHQYEWVGEFVVLLVIVTAGVFLGGLAEQEIQDRRAAEESADRLRILNDIAGELNRHSLQVDTALRAVVGRLTAGLRLNTAWVSLGDAAGAGSSVVVELWNEEPGEPAKDDNALAKVLTREVFQQGRAVGLERGFAAPLQIDGRVLGVLGAITRDGPLGAREQGLLLTVASQAAIAVENAYLIRQGEDHLRLYARRLTAAIEEERRRIARDLHDDAVQSLVVLCQSLDTLTEAVHKRPSKRLSPDLERTRELAKRILASLREFARSIRPSLLDDLGLVPAVQSLLADLSAATGIAVKFELAGDPCRLAPEVELAVFRVVQEALRNVERHARATRCEISMTFGGEGLQITVKDNGLGFEAPSSLGELATHGKLGILGMQERAQLAGGVLHISSRPGSGTTVTLATGAGR